MVIVTHTKCPRCKKGITIRREIYNNKIRVDCPLCKKVWWENFNNYPATTNTNNKKNNKISYKKEIKTSLKKDRG